MSSSVGMISWLTMHHQFLSVDRKRFFLVMILNPPTKKTSKMRIWSSTNHWNVHDCTIIVKNGKTHHLDPFLRWVHLYQNGGNSSGSKVHGLLICWSLQQNGVETLGQLRISGCTCSRCCTAPGAPPWDKSIPGLSQWIIQGLQVLARSNLPMVYSNHLLVVHGCTIYPAW